MKGNPASLKEAVFNTIHHNRKPAKQIAEELDMSLSYLTRSALPDADMRGERDPEPSGVRFPLKKLVPLIRCTGDKQILDYIANSLGCFVVEVPPSTAKPGAMLMDSVAAAAEFGDMMREIADSCGEKRLTRKQRERIHKEGWEAIQAIFQIIVGCEEGA